MSNFSAKDFQELSKKSEEIFNSMLDCVKVVKSNCKTIGDIVSSDDSSLGTRWGNVNTTLAKPITNINDTYLIIKALLNKYIEDTLANEQQAAAELEEFDTSFNSLASDAENMISGMSALAGIGFGATAISIPGVSWVNNSEIEVASDVNPGSFVPTGGFTEPSTVIEKYGPPGTFTTDPSPTNVIEKYGPPGTFTTDPSPINVIEKYGPPGTFGSEYINIGSLLETDKKSN